MKKIFLLIVFFVSFILCNNTNSTNETFDGFLDELFPIVNKTVNFTQIDYLWNLLPFDIKNETYHKIDIFKERCYLYFKKNRQKCKILFDIFGILED